MNSRYQIVGLAAALAVMAAPTAHTEQERPKPLRQELARAREEREPNRPRRFGEGRVRKRKTYIGRKHQDGRAGSKLSKKAARGKL